MRNYSHAAGVDITVLAASEERLPIVVEVNPDYASIIATISYIGAFGIDGVRVCYDEPAHCVYGNSKRADEVLAVRKDRRHTCVRIQANDAAITEVTVGSDDIGHEEVVAQDGDSLRILEVAALPHEVLGTAYGIDPNNLFHRGTDIEHVNVAVHGDRDGAGASEEATGRNGLGLTCGRVHLNDAARACNQNPAKAVYGYAVRIPQGWVRSVCEEGLVSAGRINEDQSARIGNDKLAVRQNGHAKRVPQEIAAGNNGLLAGPRINLDNVTTMHGVAGVGIDDVARLEDGSADLCKNSGSRGKSCEKWCGR